eukprot:2486555-Rhodomonas_salina.1
MKETKRFSAKKDPTKMKAMKNTLATAMLWFSTGCTPGATASCTAQRRQTRCVSRAAHARAEKTQERNIPQKSVGHHAVRAKHDTNNTRRASRGKKRARPRTSARCQTLTHFSVKARDSASMDCGNVSKEAIGLDLLRCVSTGHCVAIA